MHQMPLPPIQGGGPPVGFQPPVGNPPPGGNPPQGNAQAQAGGNPPQGNAQAQGGNLQGGILTIAATVPDPGQHFRGWYPRWWLLSAFFSTLCVVAIALLRPGLCIATQPHVLSQVCQVTAWNDWRTAVAIWIMFLLGWFVAYLFGVPTIEVDRQKRTRIAQVIRTISEFETMQTPLYILASLSFLAIFVSWRFTTFQVASFAILSIVLFVGLCCFLYHQSAPQARTTSLFGVAVLSGIFMAVMVFFGPFQLPILIAETIIICIATFQIILSLIRQRRTPGNPNPQQAFIRAQAGRNTPGGVLIGLLVAAWRVFRP